MEWKLAGTTFSLLVETLELLSVMQSGYALCVVCRSMCSRVECIGARDA